MPQFCRFVKTAPCKSVVFNRILIINIYYTTLFCKQGFRDTKAIFCLLGKLPNPHRTLPAASSCASVPDALTAVPAKDKSPVQHEHYAHTAPDIPSSAILFIFFSLLHFLLMQLLFFLLVIFQDFLHNPLRQEFAWGLTPDLCLWSMTSFYVKAKTAPRP